MAAKSRQTAATQPAPEAGSGLKLGRLLEASVPGALIVEYDGSGPLAARSTVPLDQAALSRAIGTQQPALLLFENGDARLPIVVGLVQPDPGKALLQSLLVPTSRPSPAPEPSDRAEARVDGKRVVLEGEEEVTLKCGAASITLRSDGKVILHGEYVETTAEGLNRIRGGSVKIN